MNKDEFTADVTAKAIPPVEEVAISASAINNVGTGLLYLGVAALVEQGILDADEARKKLKLPAFTTMQRDRIKATIRLHRDTGVVNIPIAHGKSLVEVMNS